MQSINGSHCAVFSQKSIMTDAFSEPALSVCALVSDRFTSLFTFARLPQLYEIT